MIPVMAQNRTILRYDALGLGVLLDLSGFLGLPASVGALFLRLVVRMRFLVIIAALPAEKKQNLLRVTGTHTDSFRSWRDVVKRITLPQGNISP